MTRRFKGRMSGERYCGDTRRRAVHDLDNEKYKCGIDSVLNGRHDRPFTALPEAHALGYGNCPWCMPALRPLAIA